MWQRHPAQELSAAVVVKTRKADNKDNVQAERTNL